MYLVLLIARVV